MSHAVVDMRYCHTANNLDCVCNKECDAISPPYEDMYFIT